MAELFADHKGLEVLQRMRYAPYTNPLGLVAYRNSNKTMHVEQEHGLEVVEGLWISDPTLIVLLQGWESVALMVEISLTGRSPDSSVTNRSTQHTFYFVLSLQI